MIGWLDDVWMMFEWCLNVWMTSWQVGSDECWLWIRMELPSGANEIMFGGWATLWVQPGSIWLASKKSLEAIPCYAWRLQTLPKSVFSLLSFLSLQKSDLTHTKKCENTLSHGISCLKKISSAQLFFRLWRKWPWSATFSQRRRGWDNIPNLLWK